MNNFEEDELQIWRIKLELAKEGNFKAIDQIKTHTSISNSNNKLNCMNFSNILLDSKIIKKARDEIIGPYELYSKVPVFLLLKGQAVLQCINLQGDIESVTKLQKAGVIQADVQGLKIKFGQGNINLLTRFQVKILEPSIIIEITQETVAKSTNTTNPDIITLREEIIMRKHMLVSLKHITKYRHVLGKPLNQKFYLLEGRACYYHNKTKMMISCYEEGYFNPLQFINTNIRLHVFEGAYIMLFEEQMMKDQVVLGIEHKREAHFQQLQKKYEKMSQNQRNTVQQKLIEKYKLNKEQVNREILGIVKQAKQVKQQKRSKSKNDFIQTSSSIKQKCGIRIRKSKRIS